MRPHQSQQEPVYSTDVGGRVLAFYQDHMCFGQERLALDDIQGLLVIRTDTYVNGAWVLGDRKVRIRTDASAIDIDCSQTLPSRDQLTNVFVGIMAPIMEIIGERLAHRFSYELADGATHSIGGADINRDGVWLDGSWKFLWWQAKLRFVPWSDIKIWSDEGKLHLACNSDLRYQREIDINTTENALVLDRDPSSLYRRELERFQELVPAMRGLSRLACRRQR